MPKIPRIMTFMVVLVVFLVDASTLWAAETKEKKAAEADISVRTLPLRFAFVKNEDRKFQADQWMKSKYAGGIDEVTLDYRDPDSGIVVESEDSIILNENNYHGSVNVKKKEDWFIDFDYEKFPKFYSDRGGTFYPFKTELASSTLGRDLELDISKIELEAGVLETDERPEIVFEYEHEHKSGDKSSLAWTSVTEGAIAKKIGPAWRAIKENVDRFGLKAKKDINGYTVKGAQFYELVTSRNRLTQETRGVKAANALGTRIQDMTLKAQEFGTHLEVDRWFLKEKVHSGAAYKFVRSFNREKENLRDNKRDFSPESYSNSSENKFNARSNSGMNSNLAILSTAVLPRPWFMINSRVKGEEQHRRGFSTYPQDLGPNSTFPNVPDGIIDRVEDSSSASVTRKLGESVSLRFKKIPKTAVYNDIELEQVKNVLNEKRDSVLLQTGTVAATDQFWRETNTFIPRFVWTLGAITQPWVFLNSSAQLRYWTENNDYDDQRESPTTTTSRSAFVDSLRLDATEVSSRTTIRPWRWTTHSFRYQLRNTNYRSRFENERDFVKTQYLGNTYTFDNTLLLRDNLLFTGSLVLYKRAVLLPTVSFPAFTSDSNTWLFSGNYSPWNGVSLFSTLHHLRAANFDDYTGAPGASVLGSPFNSSGLPLGADFTKTGVTTGVEWALCENSKVSLQYEFYRYNPNYRFDGGDGYVANVVGLEATYHWG